MNAVLQPLTGVQDAMARPLTTVDFLEAHRRARPQPDVERSRLGATEARDALGYSNGPTEVADSEGDHEQSQGIVRPGDSPRVDEGLQQEPGAGATPHISPYASVEVAEGPSQPKTGTQEDKRKKEYQAETEAPAEASKVMITFRGRDKHGAWDRIVHRMVVDRSDPSPVERMAAKNARERHATFYDTNLRQVAPALCFDAAVEDGTNTLFVTSDDDLVHNEETVDSIMRAIQDDSDRGRAAKRRQ
ncbi:hypothetical protein N7470_000633 [Penicillium chermesinum]|nr:hypothetical protein N7470_000633 [Penicillium chermesinum]